MQTAEEGSLLSWVTAWAALLILLWLVSKTEIGARLLSYVFWLAVVSLVVTRARDFASLLAPFSAASQQF